MGRRKKSDNDNPIIDLQSKYKLIRKKAQEKGFDLFFTKIDGNFVYSLVDGKTARFSTENLNSAEEFIDTNIAQTGYLRKLEKLIEKNGGKLFYLVMPDGTPTTRIANAETGFFDFDLSITNIDELTDATAEKLIP